MKPEIHWENIWQGIRKYALNKYVITIAVFACIMLFAGEQSMINRIRRARQIHALERQRDVYRSDIEKAEHDLQLLSNKDSLERFAREQYYMCAPGEDVYVIEDR